MTSFVSATWRRVERAVGEHEMRSSAYPARFAILEKTS
jgi:hypothetical protein